MYENSKLVVGLSIKKEDLNKERRHSNTLIKYAHLEKYFPKFSHIGTQRPWEAVRKWGQATSEAGNRTWQHPHRMQEL